jgi:hypothetical protein
MAIETVGSDLSGWLTHGMTQLSGSLPFNGTFPVDTQSGQGLQPTTGAVSIAQLAAQLATVNGNTQTSTVHAATSNTVGGLITTEALTTAAGADYTFTLTNSLITASSIVGVSMAFLSATAGGPIVVKSVTPAAGSVVFVFTNAGTAAFNGTMLIAFHL